MIQVVCGIIYKDSKVLLARRKEGKSFAGYWEFPGGKIEPGELESEALIRELNEELGMEVEIIDRIGAFVHSYESFDLNLIGYNCKLIKWEGILADHDKIQWVNPMELDSYKLAEADFPFINLIKNANHL